MSTGLLPLGALCLFPLAYYQRLGYHVLMHLLQHPGRVTGGRSINDQKNLDGLSPVKNAWMVRDGWMSGIPWTCDVNRPTN
ncbi:hypothetical protein BHM03_00023242 [Ensete ventricosum]|nr:hypothetical protein BHM03_00023242 [Ensete ventricosum]